MSIDLFFNGEESIDGEVLSSFTEWSREEVIKKLIEWDEFYHVEDNMPLILDSTYDTVKEYAKKKWPKDKYFKSVGAVTQKIKSKEIQHRYVLGSLNKVKGDPEASDYIGKWLDTFSDDEEFIISAKLDGLSVFQQFTDSSLTLASTRGNGFKGRDITHKIIVPVPTIQMSTGTYEFRGEIVLPGESYLDLDLKNRRNGAAGIIARDDDLGVDRLDTIIYEFINGPNLPQTEEERLQIIEQAFGKKRTVIYEKVTKKEMTVEFLEAKTNQFASHYADICDIDGLVITRNKSIRENVKYPENKCAYKAFDQVYIAIVKEIKWETGRTGRVVPVCLFKESIDIAGASISKATAYNAKFVIDLGLKPGVKVDIKRSNMVIPCIIGIHKNQ